MKDAKPLDLDSLERADTARIEFTHPVDGTPTGWHITIFGPATTEHEEAAERLRKRRLALLKRHKREEDIPGEANYASWCEFLADITQKLEITRAGVPVEATRKVVLDFFLDRKRYGPEFAAQTSTALGDLATFSKA